MSDDLIAYTLSHHPAPHRDRVGLWAQLYGMFAAPIVWSGQLMVTYALIANACYPGKLPLMSAASGLSSARTIVLILDLVAIALIASGAAVAYRCWKLTDSPPGHHYHLMDVGQGRIHYFSVVGLGFSIMFLLLAVTQTVALPFVPLCTH